jgi:replicative superfamily II helicase
MGRQPLTVAGFKQMCGRAGRLGLDSNGEAILIVSKGNTSEMNLAKSLMCSSIEPLRSVLYQGAGGGVERLLLELICCGKLTDEKDIPTFLECTLMMVQHSIQDVKHYL